VGFETILVIFVWFDLVEYFLSCGCLKFCMCFEVTVGHVTPIGRLSATTVPVSALPDRWISIFVFSVLSVLIFPVWDASMFM
jgi:hypothetical protein